MSHPLSSPDPNLILSHIHDGLVLLDLSGRIRYANHAFEEMTGRSFAEMDGMRLNEIFDGPTLQRIDPSCLSTGDDARQVHFNVEMPKPDGTTGSYCFSAVVVQDKDGNALGTLENFRDMNRLRNQILQLQEVNEAIQQEKDKTERVIDSIADGIFTVDRDRNILSFSGKMEKLTGIAADDAVGHSCPEIFHGTKCESDCPLQWSFMNSAPVERCREVLRIGRRKHISVSITTAFLDDERTNTRGLIGVVRDHTEEEQLRFQLHEKHSRHNIIGRSSQMQQVFQLIDVVAERESTVLIQGETGTGKELVAQAIHHCSLRKDGPFVMLNCAALNDNLLESELFGHVRGAFTGAVADRPGRFEMAAGGTLFLDEIGDTTPALQSKLLRALEEKSFERVGDTRTRKVDVRIIAATNRDLKKMVAEGRFREDLYFRLAVMTILIPPLRSRRDDIPFLVQHFIEKYRKRYFADREDGFEGISNRALALLMKYDWPGNVRELEHAVEHAMISTTTLRIERAFLPDAIRKLQPPDDPPADPVTTQSVTSNPEDDLRRALENHHWNASRSAKALGISRTTLWRRMKKLDLNK